MVKTGDTEVNKVDKAQAPEGRQCRVRLTVETRWGCVCAGGTGWSGKAWAGSGVRAEEASHPGEEVGRVWAACGEWAWLGVLEEWEGGCGAFPRKKVLELAQGTS